MPERVREREQAEHTAQAQQPVQAGEAAQRCHREGDEQQAQRHTPLARVIVSIGLAPRAFACQPSASSSAGSRQRTNKIAFAAAIVPAEGFWGKIHCRLGATLGCCAAQ